MKNRIIVLRFYLFFYKPKIYISMKNELWQLSACELAEGIREKKFSAEEVINSVISRIDKA